MDRHTTCRARGVAVTTLLAVSLVVLAGCGGSKPSARAPVAPAPPPPSPAPPPRDRAERVLALLQSGQVDSLLVSDAVGEFTLAGLESGSMRVDISCTGDTCTASSASITFPVLGIQSVEIGEDLSVTDLGLSEISADEWPEPGAVGHKIINDVDLARFEVLEDANLEGLGTGSEFYGGWLDYQVFAVAVGRESDPDEGFEFEAAFAMSLGDATGTVPTSGSATWQGAVVGTDMARKELVEGRARITIDDFAAPVVDAAFTQIVGLDDGAPREDMSWNDIPVTGSGFKAGADGDSIEGRFYGPQHEEVGGIFERAEILGAFGAQRP